MYDRSSPDIELPIPEIEAASEEYLLDLAFDDRLERLIDRSDHDMVRFDMDIETSFEVDKDYVPFSHMYNVDGTETPTCKLKIDGLKYSGADGSHLRVRFIPDTLYGDATTLESQGGTFVASKPPRSKELSIQQAAAMILRATGTDSVNLDNLIEKGLIDSSMCTDIAEKALLVMSEQNGQHSRESTLEITAKESSVDSLVKIRLGRVTTETPRESTLKLVIEKVWLYPELDAEQAYRFVLYFTHTHEEGSQTVHTVAEKSVRGDGFTLQSADFVHKDAQGKTTPLDYKNHDIAKLFVNAYDELVDTLPVDEQVTPEQL